MFVPRKRQQLQATSHGGDRMILLLLSSFSIAIYPAGASVLQFRPLQTMIKLK